LRDAIVFGNCGCMCKALVVSKECAGWLLVYLARSWFDEVVDAGLGVDGK
jgi:hypothetical protein